MFQCKKCKRITEPRENSNKIVVEKREKEYKNQDKITYGWEIVKEITVCNSCI